MRVRDDETRGPLRPIRPPYIHMAGYFRAMRFHHRFSALMFSFLQPVDDVCRWCLDLEGTYRYFGI